MRGQLVFAEEDLAQTILRIRRTHNRSGDPQKLFVFIYDDDNKIVPVGPVAQLDKEILFLGFQNKSGKVLALGSVSKDPTLGARVVIIGAEGWGKQQEIFVSGPITEIQQRAVARIREVLIA